MQSKPREHPCLQVHSDHALAITLRHSANIGNHTEAYLQFAMLYSNPDGQRCIRCVVWVFEL